jgi:hypothetical protein
MHAPIDKLHDQHNDGSPLESPFWPIQPDSGEHQRDKSLGWHVDFVRNNLSKITQIKTLW